MKAHLEEPAEVEKNHPPEVENEDMEYLVTKIVSQHYKLQIDTKYFTTKNPSKKLLAPKVRVPSKTAVKTANRMDHFKRHCKSKS